jgi:hypothetical protein
MDAHRSDGLGGEVANKVKALGGVEELVEGRALQLVDELVADLGGLGENARQGARHEGNDGEAHAEAAGCREGQGLAAEGAVARRLALVAIGENSVAERVIAVDSHEEEGATEATKGGANS